MKVKAIKDYFDLELKKMIKTGEEFETSETRAKELASKENKAKQPLVVIIEKPAAPKKAVAKSKKEAK